MDYKVPWLYGEEAADVNCAFAQLKNRLLPYIYSHSVRAMANGTTVADTPEGALVRLETNGGCAVLLAYYQ